MPWTAPRPALARAIPEQQAAHDIDARSVALAEAGSPCTAAACQRGRAPAAEARPARAMASVKGEAPVEVNASRSCVTASMPSPAITAGGQVARRSGSRIAIRATRRSSRKDFLNGGASSPTPGRRPERTAFLVTSLPVPAVVGTARNGVAGPVYGTPRPTPSRWSRAVVPLRSRPAMAFAASRTLPPPIPTTTSGGSCRRAATAASTSSGDGSPVTARCSQAMPASPRPRRRAPHAGAPVNDRAPVTRSARRPISATRAGSSAIRPGPTTRRGIRATPNVPTASGPAAARAPLAPPVQRPRPSRRRRRPSASSSGPAGHPAAGNSPTYGSPRRGSAIIGATVSRQAR